MTDYIAHLGLGFSSPHLYEQPSFGNPFGFGQSNFQVDTELGVYARSLGQNLSSTFNGGPTLTARFSYLGSGIEARGSHRYAPSLSVGWLQHFSNFYVSPSAGMEVGINRLNFGNGIPTQEETSLNLRFALELGVQLCMDKAVCPAAFASYQYFFNVMGSPNHAEEALSLGLRFFMPTDPPVHLPAPEGHSDYIVYHDRTYVPIEVAPTLAPPAPPTESSERRTTRTQIEAPLFFANRQSRLELLRDQRIQTRNHRTQRVAWVHHPQLETLVSALQAHPEFSVRIYASANDFSQSRQNRLLAYQRIQRVKSYLTQHGINAGRIEFVGSLVNQTVRRRQVLLDVQGASIQVDQTLPDAVHAQNPLNRSVRLELISGGTR